MTGNEFSLEQAREANAYLLTQPVTEDHWYSYALAMFARLDVLNKADQEYAEQIAEAVIAGRVRSLHSSHSSVSTASKIEALSSIAQAMYLSGADHEEFVCQIPAFITFVESRQIPMNDVVWISIPAPSPGIAAGSLAAVKKRSFEWMACSIGSTESRSTWSIKP